MEYLCGYRANEAINNSIREWWNNLLGHKKRLFQNIDNTNQDYQRKVEVTPTQYLCNPFFVYEKLI